MAGTKDGGRKTAITNKKKYGDDYYRKIGAKGGKNGNTGGFAALDKGKDGLTGRERAVKYGTVGGRISRRIKSTDFSPSASQQQTWTAVFRRNS